MRIRIDRDAVRELNAPNYYELYKRFGFRLDELAAECRAVLDDTERLWEDEGDALFRTRLGFGLDEAKPWDVGRLFRAPELDAQYPADKMLPALEATLTELGIDIRSQANVHLDLEVRPSKSPRAFCAPIEVPGKVMLVIQPIGGKDDWEALFHEAGHTEHYACTSDSLSMEGKRLGDKAVTEGWAMLMQHLVTEPAWLSRRLDVPNVDALGKDGAVSLLYFVRRYCAKLLYEIELFQVEDPTTVRSRYAELLSDALKIPIHSESYLDDVDGSFYVIGYLRSWAFEAQLREFLRRSRERVVRAARRRRPAARALVARPGADRRRAPEGRHGREARDGRGRRPDPRAALSYRGRLDRPRLGRDRRRLSDDGVLELLARSDETALAELYDRYGGPAYRLALRVLRDATLAQDAVQDAFLTAWRTAPSFDPRRGSASTWLLTLVHRRAVDVVRREDRRRALPLDDAPVAQAMRLTRRPRRASCGARCRRRSSS